MLNTPIETKAFAKLTKKATTTAFGTVPEINASIFPKTMHRTIGEP